MATLPPFALPTLDTTTIIAQGPFATVPNAVTIVRTLLAVVLGVLALQRGDVELLIIAYGCYWIGDMLDGFSARRLGQETRTGAVLDIICDRACTAVACCALVVLLPETATVVAAFLLSFMVLDTMLSLAFLCWPILSPNYFHQIDRTVWALNWSPVAKAVNTAGVVAAIAAGAYDFALLITLAVATIKAASLIRVVRRMQGR